MHTEIFKYSEIFCKVLKWAYPFYLQTSKINIEKSSLLKFWSSYMLTLAKTNNAAPRVLSDSARIHGEVGIAQTAFSSNLMVPYFVWCYITAITEIDLFSDCDAIYPS